MTFEIVYEETCIFLYENHIRILSWADELLSCFLQYWSAITPSNNWSIKNASNGRVIVFQKIDQHSYTLQLIDYLDCPFIWSISKKNHLHLIFFEWWNARISKISILLIFFFFLQLNTTVIETLLGTPDYLRIDLNGTNNFANNGSIDYHSRE